MGASLVGLTRGTRRQDVIRGALELVADSVASRLTKSVVVKPNLGCGYITKQWISTHVDALAGLFEFLVAASVREIIVVEGAPATTEKYAAFGYRTLADSFPVRFVDLNSESEWRTVELVDLNGATHTARYSSLVADAPCRISVALPKTHDLVGASLSLKNMMGCVHSHDREKVHGTRSGLWVYNSVLTSLSKTIQRWNPAVIKRARRTLSRMQLALAKARGGIIDERYLHAAGARPIALVAKMSSVLSENLCRLAHPLRPHVSVIDAVTGLEGNGPTNGTTINLGCGLAGVDFLAVDATAARIMGFDPCEIEYLHNLMLAGYGAVDVGSIEVAGEPVDCVALQFRPHVDYLGQRVWLSGRDADTSSLAPSSESQVTTES